MFCDETAPDDWAERFTGRCYFYPGRDCPGWAPGRECSRIEERIPTLPATGAAADV